MQYIKYVLSVLIGMWIGYLIMNPSTPAEAEKAVQLIGQAKGVR